MVFLPGELTNIPVSVIFIWLETFRIRRLEFGKHDTS
jgi:hypothetical protein